MDKVRDASSITLAEYQHLQNMIRSSAADMETIAFASIEDKAVADAWLAIKRGVYLIDGALVDVLKGTRKFRLSEVAAWDEDLKFKYDKMSKSICTFVDLHPYG